MERADVALARALSKYRILMEEYWKKCILGVLVFSTSVSVGGFTIIKCDWRSLLYVDVSKALNLKRGRV